MFSFRRYLDKFIGQNINLKYEDNIDNVTGENVMKLQDIQFDLLIFHFPWTKNQECSSQYTKIFDLRF